MNAAGETGLLFTVIRPVNPRDDLIDIPTQQDYCPLASSSITSSRQYHTRLVREVEYEVIDKDGITHVNPATTHFL